MTRRGREKKKKRVFKTARVSARRLPPPTCPTTPPLFFLQYA